MLHLFESLCNTMPNSRVSILYPIKDWGQKASSPNYFGEPLWQEQPVGTGTWKGPCMRCLTEIWLWWWILRRF